VAKARTTAVNFFCIGQAFYLLNCRSLAHSLFRLGPFSNPWIWAGIAAMMLTQTAFIYALAMNWLFPSEAVGREEWLPTLAGGIVIYGAVGVEKLVRRAFSHLRRGR